MNQNKVRPALRKDLADDLDRSLVLHNDDVHSFDYVIECLIEVCDHEPETAEQCALITHYNGKCTISYSDTNSLKRQAQALQSKGLKVSLQ